MKRWPAILLLLVWSIPQVLPVAMFELQRLHHHHYTFLQAKRISSRRDIKTLVFNRHAIDWVVWGKEFRHDGRLFDVVSMEMQEGIAAITCMEDPKEDIMVANYRAYQQWHPENENGVNRLLVKCADLKYLCFIRTMPPKRTTFIRYQPVTGYTHSSPIIEQPSPPPEWFPLVA